MCRCMCYLLSISFRPLDCAFVLGLELAFQARSVRNKGGTGFELASQARCVGLRNAIHAGFVAGLHVYPLGIR